MIFLFNRPGPSKTSASFHCGKHHLIHALSQDSRHFLAQILSCKKTLTINQQVKNPAVIWHLIEHFQQSSLGLWLTPYRARAILETETPVSFHNPTSTKVVKMRRCIKKYLVYRIEAGVSRDHCIFRDFWTGTAAPRPMPSTFEHTSEMFIIYYSAICVDTEFCCFCILILWRNNNSSERLYTKAIKVHLVYQSCKIVLWRLCIKKHTEPVKSLICVDIDLSLTTNGL